MAAAESRSCPSVVVEHDDRGRRQTAAAAAAAAAAAMGALDCAAPSSSATSWGASESAIAELGRRCKEVLELDVAFNGVLLRATAIDVVDPA